MLSWVSCLLDFTAWLQLVLIVLDLDARLDETGDFDFDFLIRL